MRERKNSLLTLLSISGFDSRDREEPTGLEGTTGPEGTVGPIVEALPTATPTPTVEATPASREEIGPTPVRIVAGTVLPGAELHWTEWVRQFAPRATALPMAAYHERIWEWFEELQPGVKPAALVECVFRGGGKSTTVELALARQAVRADRRFALYVSATREAANAAGSAADVRSVARENAFFPSARMAVTSIRPTPRRCWPIGPRVARRRGRRRIARPSRSM